MASNTCGAGRPGYAPLGARCGSPESEFGPGTTKAARSRPWWPDANVLAISNGAACQLRIQTPEGAIIATGGPYSPIIAETAPSTGQKANDSASEEEEDLEQLTDLLLGKPPPTPPAGQDLVNVAPNGNAMDLEKTETSDSTQLNAMLATLQLGAKQRSRPPQQPQRWLPGYLQDFGSRIEMNGTTASPTGTAGQPGLQQQDAAAAAVAACSMMFKDFSAHGCDGIDRGVDDDDDDVPLVSKRGCAAVATHAIVPVVEPVAVRRPGIVSDDAHTFACPSSSPAHAASGNNAVNAGHQQQALVPAGGTGGGALPPALRLFRPHPAWQAEASSLLFVAVFLTPESREVLLSVVPPVHPAVSADHMTLGFRPSVEELLNYPLGAEVQLNIIGQACDSRAQAVVADPPSWLPPIASGCTHVTISVATGIKPVEAGQLVKDALHRAAVQDPTSPSPSGAGAYQHFEEPLPLVGRIGVKLADGPGRVLFSLAELVGASVVSMGTDNLELYTLKHQAILGTKPLALPSPGSSPVDFSVTTSSPTGDLAAHLSPFMSPAGSPLLAGQQGPPLHGLPPAALSPSADGPGSPVPPAPFALEQALLQCSPLAQVACASPPGTPPAAAAGGPSTAHSSASSSADSGSSGSSGEVVQFKSSVQLGDYVTVRPFVAADDGDGDAQASGFVREFACDEPFQGGGVMVVLDDATIGFVSAVLDAADAAAVAGGSRAGQRKQQQRAAGSKGRGRSKGSRKAGGGSGGGGAAAAPVVARPQYGSPTGRGADELSAWALSALSDAADGVASAGSGVGVRSSTAARRDLELWQEFDALQQQHGESVCGAVLASCKGDFGAAIALIRQQSEAAAAAAAAGPAGQQEAAAVEQQAAVAPEAARDDDDLLQQLALSLGLPAEGAVRLARLAPHLPADRLVRLLQRHGGDANAAADELLSGEGGSAGPASPPAAAAPAAAPSSPGARAARSFLAGVDPQLAADIGRLLAAFPGLSRETAELVLTEHNGDLDKAAEAVSEMQASEMEARTAAAAGTSAGSSPATGLQQQQAAVVGVTHHLSEEDQIAILQAMGELPQDGAAGGQQQAGGSRAGAAKQGQQQQRRPLSPGAAAGVAGVFGSPSRRPQSAPRGVLPFDGAGSSSGHNNNMNEEARKATMLRVDELYKTARTLMECHEVYATVAQACAKAGDMEGFRKQKAHMDKLRVQARAARDQAQRLSWAANNANVAEWMIDLHGQSKDKGLDFFVRHLDMLCALAEDKPNGVMFKVIVGQGHHSENNVPIIKLRVLQYLEERAEYERAAAGRDWPVDWWVDEENPGLVRVHMRPSDSDGHSEQRQA